MVTRILLNEVPPVVGPGLHYPICTSPNQPLDPADLFSDFASCFHPGSTRSLRSLQIKCTTRFGRSKFTSLTIYVPKQNLNLGNISATSRQLETRLVRSKNWMETINKRVKEGGNASLRVDLIFHALTEPSAREYASGEQPGLIWSFFP